MITLPCGHIIVPRCDIVTSYNGGHNDLRVAQSAERMRIIAEMTERGYTKRDIIRLAGIPKKAVERLIYQRSARVNRSTQTRKHAEPVVPTDPVVAAFWARWDARKPFPANDK